MPKGRDLKSKLKHYSVGSQQPRRSAQEPASVTERLAQLRVEQLRAEKNRRPHEPAVVTIPTSSTYSPRVAGPAPPPSWTRKAVARRPSACQRPEQPTDTLFQLCAERALDFVMYHPHVISTLPIAAKQQVLNRLGSRLTDTLLSRFKDECYSELNLHSARISFSTFVRCFWRTEAIVEQDQVEDWEEQVEEEEEEDYYERYEYDPTMDWMVDPVIQLLKQPDQPQILMTVLSKKLVSLDLSFVALPSYAAPLITLTLPHLSNLALAGCFSQNPGLVMMAKQMRQLRRWDIGYHGWLDATVTDQIDWGRDLQHLVCTPPGKHDHQHSSNQISRPVQRHLINVYLVLAAMLGLAAYGSVQQPLFNGALETTVALGSATGVLFLNQDNIIRWALLAIYSLFSGMSLSALVSQFLYMDPSGTLLLGILSAAMFIFLGLSASAMLANRRSMMYVGGMAGSLIGILAWTGIANLFFLRSPALFSAELYVGLIAFSGFGNEKEIDLCAQGKGD
ncbi:hypothetical protein BJV82DRAFT_576644 [Fennellomyces sp. T-0311]|nr:hypothetical protein BJV82DRAFT_576644 [Fennellomyces sp. T-0311]